MNMKNDKLGTFVDTVSLYSQEYRSIMHRLHVCALHEEFLGGKVYGNWKMDLAASDYRLSHNQLDLLIEQRKVGLSILALNRMAKTDPAIRDYFLGRVYSIKNVPEKGASDEEIATFCKDVRGLLEDFEDLNDQATQISPQQ